MIEVLFVCMGNICRSPTAEGVFRHIVEGAGHKQKIGIDSAGTIAHHAGESPDPRAQETALRHGVDLSKQRARQVLVADFNRFDYIIAMDKENLSELRNLKPASFDGHLGLLLDFAPSVKRDSVPDPYYGGDGGFEAVFEMVTEASHGLLRDIEGNHLAG